MLRLVALAFLATLAVAGCGDETPEVVGWSGPAELRPRDGVLEVEPFRRHAEAVEEDWEREPAALATEFLQVDGEVAADGARVVVSRDDLQDDSIRAERWVLVLERDGEHWALRSARWEQRCHRGRGHQGFSSDLCL